MPSLIIYKSHTGRQTTSITTTPRTRKPLGDITPNVDRKNNIGDPKQSLCAAKTHPATATSTPSYTEHDHKGQLIASLEKALKLVSVIQQRHRETFPACQSLTNTLNQLHGLVDALYVNATWFHHSPPNSLNQTLRRLRNWALSASRSEGSDTASSANIDAFALKLEQIAREIAIE